MIQSLAHQLPGSRFTRGINFNPISAQVPAFTAGELQHARRNDILRGVDIPVVFTPALRARPLPDIEPQLVELVAAVAASLRAWVKSVHRDHGTAIPPGLVLDHATELSETRIGDMPRQSRVLNHAFHVQIFDADNLVLAHKPGGQRVQRIASLIRHGTVGAGDAQPLFLAALAAFHATRQAPLLLLEIPESGRELARIGDLLAAGKRSQMCQPQVNADHRGRDRQQRNLDRGGERDVVTPVRLALERDGIGAGGGGKFLGELHGPELRQAHDATRPLRFADILESERNRIVVSGSEAWIARRLACLHTPEEMGEGGILIAQGLRQARGRRLGKPSETWERLELCKTAGNIHAGERFFAPLVGLGARIERPVPQPTGSAEPLVQHADLRPIGVGANTVGSLYGGHANIIIRPQRITNYGASPLCRATGAAARSPGGLSRRVRCAHFIHGSLE